jgi:all-trans-retinol 13,14-reductase
VLYCSFPSLKDPAHDPGPELRHTGEVVTFAPWDAFAPWREQAWKKRGADYEALKARLTDALLAQLFRHRPGLRPLLDYAELSTPLSTDNFCRPIAGSIYGLEPTPERFRNPWLRPRSPVPGLYFAGSDVASVGVIGAMMGGVLAAAAVAPVGTFRLMRELRG